MKVRIVTSKYGTYLCEIHPNFLPEDKRAELTNYIDRFMEAKHILGYTAPGGKYVSREGKRPMEMWRGNLPEITIENGSRLAILAQQVAPLTHKMRFPDPKIVSVYEKTCSNCPTTIPGDMYDNGSWKPHDKSVKVLKGGKVICSECEIKHEKFARLPIFKRRYDLQIFNQTSC